MVEGGALGTGGEHVGAAQPGALLGLPARLGLEPLALRRVVEEGRETPGDEPAAPGEPGAPDAFGRVAERGRLDDAADGLETLQCVLADVEMPGSIGR